MKEQEASRSEKDTFCVLAWNHIATNSSGNLRLCCNSVPGQNVIKADDGTIFRLDGASILPAYHSNWMRGIRQKMLNGETVDICQRCYKEEGAGLKSARQSWNQKYKSTREQVIAMEVTQAVDYFEPQYLDLRLGNLCNLKCRMCNPYASRKWLEDWDGVSVNEALAPEEFQRLATMDWFENEQMKDNLLEVMSTIQEIYFTGGEPFLINQHIKFLELLVAKNGASGVALKYNTNMTLLPQKIYELWPYFKKVTINASIDGIGAVNDYIRAPSKWTNVSENLTQLDQLIASQKNLYGSIHTTVQMYNIEHILDLIEYMKNFRGFENFPYLNILNHPAFLNVRNLPQDFKAVMIGEISKWLDVNGSHYSPGVCARLSGLIQYMSKENLELQDEFLKYTYQLDEKRNQKLSDISPRLAELFL